ncbi:MAG: hypothetical protein EBS05_04240 [Proteobacteria bacterium]|nr:hypothetical protein [Pseudomonadota bacterium]
MQAFMKSVVLTPLIALLACTSQLRAAVALTELEDRIRVTIDGEVFTEWRHKDWVGPYLYPVIGPNGENVTRHFPMKPGVPGEDVDHPHHRSIRFSHSDVNGFNFWWSPPKPKPGQSAEVKLEKIERMTSGQTGEVVLWNQWLGDGKLVLREKVRLAFTPLANRQVLMDYDVELQAANAPVVFGDKRDGGLLTRVAGTMKVESEKGEKGLGTIVNSRGDRNEAAWGKRAEWTDYFGPDATGKTVGIAMFDHPTNLRFPTHWHARTYGLMTANRFGTDHFKGNYNDHKTLSCRPYGTNCPACSSHSGDFTLAAGQTLSLRNRFYFHHGDAQVAQVAAQYNSYTADPDALLGRMRALQQDRKWKELIAQFGAEDFAAWPAQVKASEALHLRGQIYSFLKDGPHAEADLKAAIKLAPSNSAIWLTLGENYVNNLNDDAQALAAFRQALKITGQGQGWQPLTATVSIARILTSQVKPAEAIQVLQQYGDLAGMATTWRIQLLRAYGHAYAAQGKEQESLAKFREALKLEAKP